MAANEGTDADRCVMMTLTSGDREAAEKWPHDLLDTVACVGGHDLIRIRVTSPHPRGVLSQEVMMKLIRAIDDDWLSDQILRS